MAINLKSLGNFLSGMETERWLWLSFRWAVALETSLVEWKLLERVETDRVGVLLGNFLSGMETDAVILLSYIYPCLGNFLSGMETDLAQLRRSQGRQPWKLP